MHLYEQIRDGNKAAVCSWRTELLFAKSHRTPWVLCDFFRFLNFCSLFHISHTVIIPCSGICLVLYLQRRGRASGKQTKHQVCLVLWPFPAQLLPKILRKFTAVLCGYSWPPQNNPVFASSKDLRAFFVRQCKLTCLKSQVRSCCSETLNCDHHGGRTASSSSVHLSSSLTASSAFINWDLGHQNQAASFQLGTVVNLKSSQWRVSTGVSTISRACLQREGLAFLLSPFSWLECGCDGWCLGRYIGLRSNVLMLGVGRTGVASLRRVKMITVMRGLALSYSELLLVFQNLLRKPILTNTIAYAILCLIATS